MAMMIPHPISPITEAKTPRRLTAEELNTLPEDGRVCELIEGEITEMPPAGSDHSDLAMYIGYLLNGFVRPRQLGSVTGEQGGYLISENPDTVRAPAVAFISWARRQKRGAYVKGGPDLAVEIVSASDTATTLQRKVKDYLAAGTRLVWVVYLELAVIVVHTPQMARTLTTADTLDGGDVLPGFSAAIADIFAILAPPSTPLEALGTDTEG